VTDPTGGSAGSDSDAVPGSGATPGSDAVAGSGSDIDRRTLLSAIAGAGVGALAGCSATERGEDSETTEVADETAKELAIRFAPTLYFDQAEPWLPTDPRPYASEVDGESIVDGFDALDGYHERYAEMGEPPDPAVFYRAVEYDESPLVVVQFWMYSAFDQFTANFHWHDWEVLHVYVDTETDRPQLYVASSHSRKIPNNEFLDPEPEMVPRILSELGSHSSALSVNDEPNRFQRLAGGDLAADITNSAIESLEALSELPLAYGLPRDEGGRLPFVVPEYEGAPVYEHDRLPNVDSESLVDEELTIRSFEALTSPPTDLPERSTGIVLRHAEREEPAAEDAVADEEATSYDYELLPASEVQDITDYTGPQLSFEFAVPQFAEDAVAGHITTTGAPWDQPRVENPAADITDPNHRRELSNRYDAIGDAAAINTVVTRITEAIPTDDAPEGEGLTTQAGTVEAIALLESEPAMVPTFGGVAVARDVPEGEHRLTVNAAGQAPHSQRLTVGGGSDDTATASGSDDTATASGSDDTATASETDTATATTRTTDTATTDATATSGSEQPTSDESDPAQRITTAGVDTEIPLVARENAQKLEVDAEGTDADLSDLAVEDDFAGRLYDAPLDGPDAVYVHRGGAYTTEVRDTEGEIGAFRVNPDPDVESDGDTETPPSVRIDRPDTGKASLSSFLASIAAETRDETAELIDDDDDQQATLEGGENALRGLVRALDAIVTAAERAAENARKGNGKRADRQLDAVANGLETVVERIEAASEDLPDPLTNAARNRVEQATRRTEQAKAAKRL
jgi:hypothetical protein